MQICRLQQTDFVKKKYRVILSLKKTLRWDCSGWVLSVVASLAIVLGKLGKLVGSLVTYPKDELVKFVPLSGLFIRGTVALEERREVQEGVFIFFPWSGMSSI